MNFLPGLLLSFVLVGGCSAPPAEDEATPSRAAGEAPLREVLTYRACESAPPGELVAIPRQVPGEADRAAAAIREVVGGVNEEERAAGCTSFFSSATEDAVNTVTRSGGETLLVDFSDFSDQLPERPGVKSFLPPGIMAELTWTIFDQFPGIDAVRFSFEGDEGAFWRWLTENESDAKAFTREMWERV